MGFNKNNKNAQRYFQEAFGFNIVCRNSLPESELSFIDLQQTMSQSILCFLKIQLGDKQKKH